MQKEILEHGLSLNRRRFLQRAGLGIGSIALGSLLIPNLFGSSEDDMPQLGLPHFAPRAKRIIYLFQNGAPSQLDLFDYKPLLQQMHGQDLPESVRLGQRLTGMTADQKNSPSPEPTSNSANTARPAPGLVNSCPIPPKWSTISASSKACSPRPSTMTPP